MERDVRVCPVTDQHRWWLRPAKCRLPWVIVCVGLLLAALVQVGEYRHLTEARRVVLAQNELRMDATRDLTREILLHMRHDLHFVVDRAGPLPLDPDHIRDVIESHRHEDLYRGMYVMERGWTPDDDLLVSDGAPLGIYDDVLAEQVGNWSRSWGQDTEWDLHHAEGNEALICSAPLIRDGEVVAVFAAIMDAAVLSDQLDRGNYANRVVIVDDHGHLLGNPGLPETATDWIRREAGYEAGGPDAFFASADQAFDRGGWTVLWTELPLVGLSWRMIFEYDEDTYLGSPVRRVLWSWGLSLCLLVVSIAAAQTVAAHRRRTRERLAYTAEIENANAQLERRVVERTADLVSAQETVVQNERLAALGGMVASVAHEVNTPLGVGFTASTHLETHVGEIATAFENGTMTRSDLTSFLDTATRSCAILTSNLRRAGDLVQSFKEVSVDQVGADSRRFPMATFLADTLLGLKDALSAADIRLRQECPDDLVVTAMPGVLLQVITNLVMNSMMHAFPDGAEGNVTVRAYQEDRLLALEVEDDGRGMADEVRTRVFDPFFTTREGEEGGGLGLHIVYNLVTLSMGGRIACESVPGEGTVFRMTFSASADSPGPAVVESETVELT